MRPCSIPSVIPRGRGRVRFGLLEWAAALAVGTVVSDGNGSNHAFTTEG
jgi:hypothetical protein